MTAEAESVATDEARVLVVDDEPSIRRVLVTALERAGVTVSAAGGGREALQRAKQMGHLDVVVTDLLMPDRSGLDVLKGIQRTHPQARIILVSGHATIRTAVEAMRMGAFDFIVKPFDIEQVLEVVERALQAPGRKEGEARSADAPRAAEETSGAALRLRRVPPIGSLGKMVGDAPATRTLGEQILRAAGSRATVLLLGESGTGKEVAARLLHESSARRTGPFVAVSCAALPETLLESELFGHEKSAFTGAAGTRLGRFELAHGGTLFLDEIGDIPPLTQVKLLRALQEREITRIGGSRAIPVDVRVVAATNRDLLRAVREGTFRLDLYYRLHVIPVALPPLRERREDIEPLARHFLELLRRGGERAFSEGIAPETLELLSAHDWPGNIRELQNALEYAVVMAEPTANRLEPAALPPLIPWGAVNTQNNA